VVQKRLIKKALYNIYLVYYINNNTQMKERKLNKINKELFFELYNKGFSDNYISKKMNCRGETVRRYRKRRNLKANVYISKFDTFIKNEKVLYTIANNTYAEHLDIFKNLNISESMYYKIKTHLINNKLIVVNEEYVPTDEEKSILIGCILGDGYISKGKNRATFNFQHCYKQKEYCLHKADKLKTLIKYTKICDRFDKRFKVNNYKIVMAYSKSFNFLADLRKKIYVPKKEITLEILEQMNFNEKSLAYLYMDDGSFSNYTIKFCLNSYSVESLNILKNYLKEKFNLEFRVNSYKYGNILLLNKGQKETFFNLIKPFIHYSMNYKIGLLTGLNGEHPEVDNPVPMTLEIKEC
jgi:hypothetical protein